MQYPLAKHDFKLLASRLIGGMRPDEQENGYTRIERAIIIAWNHVPHRTYLKVLEVLEVWIPASSHLEPSCSWQPAPLGHHTSTTACQDHQGEGVLSSFIPS